MIKLLIKESFRTFLKKITLYLNLTLFLIIIISIFCGMLSFSYSFSNNFYQTFGHQTANAHLNTSYSFLPSWAEKDKDEALKNNFINFENKQNNNKNKEGYISEFLRKMISKPSSEVFDFSKLLNDDESFNRLILGLGYFEGYARKLNSDDITKNSILSKYFSDDVNNNINKSTKFEKIEQYNEQIEKLVRLLSKEYITFNIQTAYFLDFIQKNADKYNLLSDPYYNSHFQDYDSLGRKYSWEFLQVNKDLISEDFYNDTHTLLRANPTNISKVWSNVNWNEKNNNKHLKDFTFVYVQPAFFLSNKNLKVGDEITLTYRISEFYKKTETFLIAGEITQNNNFYTSNGYKFLLPYQWIDNLYNNVDDQVIFPYAYLGGINFYVKNFSNLIKSQKHASEIFMEVFTNIQYPKLALQTDTFWISDLAFNAFKLSLTLFLVISLIIGIFSLVLFGVVFYFITKEIVNMQKHSLFFLKSIGWGRKVLGGLTSLSMCVPLLFSIIGGFFGSLWIKILMSKTAMTNTPFIEKYFQFSWVFIVIFIGIIIALIVILYLVSILAISPKNLNFYKDKSSTRLKFGQKLKSITISKFPSKIRIKIIFTFKNCYKNLVSYLMLTITFSLILFTIQFSISLKTSARDYQKWNRPFQSVNYATDLNLFSPVDDEKQYIRSYETITIKDNVNEVNVFMNPINNLKDLEEAMKEYKNSIENKNDIDITKYYLTKNFTKKVLEQISNDMEKYQKFLKEVRQWLEEHFDDPSTVDEIMNICIDILKNILNKYNSIENEYGYNEGFNIFFGKVLNKRNDARNVFSVDTKIVNLQKDNIITVAFENGDYDSQYFYNFSRNLKTDDFLIDEEYIDDDNKETKIVKELLNINISRYLASSANLKRGNILKLEMDGLKSAYSPAHSYIYAKVGSIVNGETIKPIIYTSQTGLIKYLLNQADFEISQTQKMTITVGNIQNKPLLDWSLQKEQYEKLLKFLEDIESKEKNGISNTVYTLDKNIPFGIQNITIPIYRETKKGKPKSNLNDFFDSVYLSKKLQNMGKNALIMSLVNTMILNKAKPFIDILSYFAIIFFFLVILISSILCSLILLENRQIILVFKVLGYRQNEINIYIISGYLLAGIFAVISGAVIASLLINKSGSIFLSIFGVSIYFIINRQLIVLCLVLLSCFISMIWVTISIFTKLQKPNQALAYL